MNLMAEESPLSVSARAVYSSFILMLMLKSCTAESGIVTFIEPVKAKTRLMGSWGSQQDMLSKRKKKSLPNLP